MLFRRAVCVVANSPHHYVLISTCCSLMAARELRPDCTGLANALVLFSYFKYNAEKPVAAAPCNSIQPETRRVTGSLLTYYYYEIVIVLFWNIYFVFIFLLCVFGSLNVFFNYILHTFKFSGLVYTIWTSLSIYFIATWTSVPQLLLMLPC